MLSDRSPGGEEVSGANRQELRGPGAPDAAELEALRGEKLAAIKRAIDAGEYDSDVVLQLALERMIESVEAESARTAVVHDDQQHGSM